MFDELAAIGNIAHRLLQSRMLGATNWRQVFALFLAMERLHLQAMQVAVILHPGIGLPDQLPGTRPHYMKVGNDMFAELDEAARAMVESMSKQCAYGRSRTMMHDHGMEQAFSHHFHPKSHWYIHFLGEYRSGRISVDGTVIERTIFRLHPAPTRRILGDDMEAHALYGDELLDCSTEGARAALVERSRAPLQALKASGDSIAQLLREHCTINDLLRSPTSFTS